MGNLHIGPDFDGETYRRSKDHARLSSQLERVFDVMKDGRWRTLRCLAKKADGSEPSVSARLRDLRKKKFGGFEVKRKRWKDGGLWVYKLVIPEDDDEL